MIQLFSFISEVAEGIGWETRLRIAHLGGVGVWVVWGFVGGGWLWGLQGCGEGALLW